MTLEEFVTQVRSGNILVRGGVLDNGKLIEGVTKLLPTAHNITAEAYDKDLIDLSVKWEDGIRLVENILGKTNPIKVVRQ